MRHARMHLHAASLAFIHPATRVPVRFSSTVPF
jgi:23S rRNA-/tRNA-specific pseudouridylate synthase